MSNKHRRDLNGKNLPRYVRLFHWIMDSEAWKDLSANARSIYLEISKRYNGANNGRIVYSVRQAAEELKIGKSTAARAFDALQSHGFIVPEQRGHFHWKINPDGSKKRPASEWRLTSYGSNIAPDFDSQQHGSKEFMRWTKIQNAVPPQVRMVPNTGPQGTYSGTMRSKKVVDGTHSGTIKGVMRG